MTIQVDSLSKHYPSGDQVQTIFDGLSFSVAEGEAVALVGASGSGKTTLLNLISGIDQPDDGSVRIAGQSVHEQQEPQRTLFRRRHLGFVFQFFNLVPTLTVAENIAFPLELLNRPDPAERVRTLLESVGLGHTASRYPETLSGGEQQRIAIARALAHEPTVLLADEPTGNLDETSGGRVIDLLLELAHEAGVTMLLVTHSDAVARSADRVLRLEHGQIHHAA